MKNILKIDHAKRTIVMDCTFEKLAENTMSKEYAHLQQVRRDYPHYEVIRRTIKRNSNKKTYAGLTYEYMEEYILTHGTKEQRMATLAEYNEMVLISKCHGKAYRYPVIKRWFLEKYPEIAEFGAPTAKIVEEGVTPAKMEENAVPAVEAPCQIEAPAQDSPILLPAAS